ncbi:MAG: twin-arginine translocation pathway signal protein, partial [Acidobacteriota bacterium]|nr:twin-arginine translocation pathway signal protein [Acidobacteriota bacterium]
TIPTSKIDNYMKADILTVNRRRAIGLLAGAGVSALLPPGAEQNLEAASCGAATPAEIEGPYFVEENLNRSDIRVDPADGSMRPGVPLTLKISLSESGAAGCGALAGARVEI